MSGAIAWSASSFGLQSPVDSPLIESGRITVAGRSIPFRIRRLPVSSFPDLPSPIAGELNARGCLIPQTFEAKRPENVIRGSLERAGSEDWAALCAVQGKVSLLVFFASASPSAPTVLISGAETDFLQAHDPSGELGFNWAIDPASPERVHEAQAGMAHRPPLADHDCLADSIVDRRTTYHLYRNGAWEDVDVAHSD